jgi:predicted TIM-barrel fold metal-dependent hydrolase
MSASGNYGEARACAGIVGYADLKLGANVTPVLEAIVRAGGGRLCGIRFPVAWHPHKDVCLTRQPTSPELLRDARVAAGAAALARAGLTLDIWIGHTQLPELYDLAKAVPEVTIILDHVGGPIGCGPYVGHATEVFAEWKESMRLVASAPNVNVKLGGLAQRVNGFNYDLRPLPPTSEQIAADWRPCIGTCIDLFGPGRCMFESNFPVDKGMVSYRTLWNAYKRLAKDFSADETHALFAGTARRVYGFKG